MSARPILWLVFGCAGEPKRAADSAAVEVVACPEDADGDGYPVDVDCRDDDGAIHPGADELCDGLDNDCDGMSDEDVGFRYYGDADGDGFGDPDIFDDLCEAQGGVPNGDDCDDTDRNVNPNADELCDGFDNDCDGLVDDLDDDRRDPPTWYLDADGDGYGGSRLSIASCTAPVAFVDGASDCDDLDPLVSPGATEVADGVDNDCDLEVDEGD